MHHGRRLLDVGPIGACFSCREFLQRVFAENFFFFFFFFFSGALGQRS